MRLSVSSSSLAAAFAAFILVGCGGNIDFSIQRTFDVDSNVSSGRAEPSQVNLAAEAGKAWKERKRIDKITIHSVTAEVLDPVVAGEGLALTGRAWLHEVGVTDEAQWIEVGPQTGTFTAGEIIDLPVTPELSAFVTSQLKGDGQFVLEAESTSSAGRIAGRVRVTLDATLKWSLL